VYALAYSLLEAYEMNVLPTSRAMVAARASVSFENSILIIRYKNSLYLEGAR
jgi:hypothetical protein